MSNFKTNINLDADLIAHMVSRMHVPSSHALMGIAPALAVIFGTDSTDAIVDELHGLSALESADLGNKIQSVIASEVYPLSETVWQFNDPAADIRVLTTALGLDTPDTEDRKYAMYDLMCMLDMTRDTYPYIEIGSGHISETDILEFCEDGMSVRSNPPEKPTVGAGVWLVPSLTVGSLALLGSKLNER